MKYISEFRDQKLAGKIVNKIAEISKELGRQIRLMEVCGTHTMAILKFGIKELIPPNIKLVAGPGCPVCVTPNQYIDIACAYATKGFLITTFGDMIKVPGSKTSLIKEKSKGKKIKVVYSPMDALKLAKNHPEEKVIFLGIGFETTIPTIAASLSIAKEEGIENFMVLCGHKLIPPAMKALMKSAEVKIDGFLCPGHVSIIIGSKAYDFLAKSYNIPCVITGFEPLDVLQGINLLLSQICHNEAKVENEYARVVLPEGNLNAQQLMNRVFKVDNSSWRGLGIIKGSGLRISSDYSWWDVQTRYPIEVTSSEENKDCRCEEILRGLIEPPECALFGSSCTPSNPFGPCMVSTEGTCQAYYRFQDKKENN